MKGEGRFSHSVPIRNPEPLFQKNNSSAEKPSTWAVSFFISAFINCLLKNTYFGFVLSIVSDNSLTKSERSLGVNDISLL